MTGTFTDPNDKKTPQFQALSSRTRPSAPGSSGRPTPAPSCWNSRNSDSDGEKDSPGARECFGAVDLFTERFCRVCATAPNLDPSQKVLSISVFVADVARAVEPGFAFVQIAQLNGVTRHVVAHQPFSWELVENWRERIVSFLRAS